MDTTQSSSWNNQFLTGHISTLNIIETPAEILARELATEVSIQRSLRELGFNEADVIRRRLGGKSR